MNGVPIKRVDQVYTIATSAKVDVKGANFDKISDDTFKREAGKKSRSHKFFENEAPKKTVSDDRKSLQKDVDAALLKNIKENEMKVKYL